MNAVRFRQKNVPGFRERPLETELPGAAVRMHALNPTFHMETPVRCSATQEHRPYHCNSYRSSLDTGLWIERFRLFQKLNPHMQSGDLTGTLVHGRSRYCAELRR